MKKISFENLNTISLKSDGLSDAEVISQRKLYGKNEIVEVTGNPWLELILDTLKDPMIWFLSGIGIVFLLVGNFSEAVVLFVAIIPLVFMDAILHFRTHLSTSSLKGQLASTVSVLRNAKELQIDSNDLVPGDLILIKSGLLIPADGYFQGAIDLQVDESILTGETYPLTKKNIYFNPSEFILAGEISIDPTALGFAGTRILTGNGYLRVLSTGIHTAYGEIVQSVAALPHDRTPLQKSITQLVKGLIIASGIFCLLLAAVRIYQGHGWLDALLSAATLAIAAIPEEFPVVFTFFLGVGVYRLAKKHALVRRAVSVENIGRVTYICTDKTGTITTGKLKLMAIEPFTNFTELDLLQTGLSASNPNGLDPMDLAIQNAATKKGLTAFQSMQIFPFTEDRKQETIIAKDNNGISFAFMKGSPETVLSYSLLSIEERNLWLNNISKWASEGHKVLACARKKLTLLEVDQKIEPKNDFDFCGLLTFTDPARPEVAEAITYCSQNKIRVLMITGDHPATAKAIAKDIGLGGEFLRVISAEENLEKFQETWLDQNPNFLSELDVIARCTPMQKLKIVTALKNQGELVAVTGDGVNDVPALKAADIGIAMGERGTRSAKEVSSIVLADDNFRTIANAIMEGRQLFLNLKMSFKYLLLFHIPFVLSAALIPLFGYPILYLPIHIVWLELIIHPTALFAFQQEASTKTISRTEQNNFFTAAETTLIILIGIGLTAVLGFIFYMDIKTNFSLVPNADSNMNHARANAIALLICWSAGLIAYLSKLKTRASVVILIITTLTSILFIQLPVFAKLFHLAQLNLMEWLHTIGVILLFILCLSLGRRLFRIFG
ncbi:MAG: cation-transporting P-type ATPase [Pseudobdellovibrio sp.]